MQTIEDYDHQIHLQQCQIDDRKSAFEDAVAEITELRSKNESTLAALRNQYNQNQILRKKISRSAQPRDKQGHFVKQKPIESEYWECIITGYGHFLKGKTYKQDKSITRANDLLWLFAHEDHLHPYLVSKKDFKPVIK